jgi:hypothetical protein
VILLLKHACAEVERLLPETARKRLQQNWVSSQMTRRQQNRGANEASKGKMLTIEYPASERASCRGRALTGHSGLTRAAAAAAVQ